MDYAVARARWRGSADASQAFSVTAVLVFIAVAAATLQIYRFPSPFDELAHYSVIRAQFEHPDLFADPRGYLFVDQNAPHDWLAQRNYINHPALYYLLLSPIMWLGDSIFALRFANLVIATAALVMTIAAGWRLLPGRFERAAFAVIAACFPKAMIVAGMINNDNLAALAAALVFAGLSGMKRGTVLMACGLALAGWTKLTALIALAALVGICLLIRHRRLFTRENWVALAGALIGALPYLVMRAKTGAFVPVNVDAWRVPVAHRANWDFAEYTRYFFESLALKWPAADASLPLIVSVALVLLPIALAILCVLRPSPARPVVAATLGATAITLVIHLGFGWQSFRTIGDITIAQTRYYNTLWPGLALGGAVALGWLRARVPTAPLLLIGYLAPTMLGTLILMNL
jgi:hypothetical protein